MAVYNSYTGLNPSQAYLILSSAVTTSTPLTIVGWCNATTTGVIGSINAGPGTGGTDCWSLVINGTGNAAADVKRGIAQSSAESTGVAGDGSWHHLAAVFASSTSRTVYLDGVAGAQDTANIDPGASGLLNQTTLYSRYIGLSTSYIDTLSGCVKDVAIYSAALSSDDIALLAAGSTPDEVQPGSLIFYAPLTNNASKTDNTVGTDLTVVGEAYFSTCTDPPATNPDIALSAGGQYTRIYG